MSDNSKRLLLFSSNKFIVELDSHPFSPGAVYVNLKSPESEANTKAITVLDLPVDTFVDLLLLAQKVAKKLCEILKVQRCAMVGSTKGSEDNTLGVRIIPLHGLKAEWKPIIEEGEFEFHENFPGYISSKNGPKLAEKRLVEIEAQVRAKLKDTDDKSYSDEFHGDHWTDRNLFVKIIRGEINQWRVWENKNHIAFFTPFPNTPGFTVVIPRKHLSSDIFSLEKDDYIALLKASHYVASLLCEGIPNACSCGIIFEGYEIDYSHVKLIPIIGDSTTKCDDIDFCEEYKGYVISKMGKKLVGSEIKEWMKKLNDLLSDSE